MDYINTGFLPTRKRQKTDDSTTKNLPDDLICTEIFSRLPTKSVGRCRCLSKSWRIRLSSSQFINLHLTRKPHQEHIITIRDYSVDIITCSTSTQAASRQKIDQLSNTWQKTVIGSCNGLVLLGLVDSFILLNPITVQQLEVQSPTLTSKEFNYRDAGFGYDSSTDDYKIVVATYVGPFSPDISIEIYSFKKNAWKTLKADDLNRNYPHVFVEYRCILNGAMHWSAMTAQPGRGVIVALDLATEDIREIPLPADFYGVDDLVTIRGCLCTLAEAEVYLDFEIWMMREYGVVDSWTKLITVSYSIRYVIPSVLSWEDEFVIGIEDEGLVLYNIRERTTKNIILDGFVYWQVKQVWSFVDSLISPNQVAGASYQ